MSRGYINYWHIQFKTLNNCIFSVEWLLVRWFIRNNVLILFLLKVSQKKLSSSQREKIKNKKIQCFDSWVAITNSFHIPTLKKPLKKKNQILSIVSLSIHSSLPFSLSHSLLKCISYAQFWNNFSLFGWKTQKNGFVANDSKFPGSISPNDSTGFESFYSRYPKCIRSYLLGKITLNPQFLLLLS